MATATLTAKLVGDAKGMVDAFDRAGRSADGLDQSQGRLGAGLSALKGNYLLAAGAVGAATAATAGAVAMANKMVMAAAEDQASQARLQKAIENTGISYSTVSGEVERLIKRGQELAFSDDQTREGLATLEAQTSSHAEAVKRLGLAQDLARGTGMELATASRLLGKVTDENVNVLNRYGISVGKGASETELFAAVQKKFGGQATTYANQSVASFDRLKDRIAEAQESIGYKLMPVIARGAEEAVKAIDGIGAALQNIVNSGPYQIAVEFTGGVLGAGAQTWMGRAGDIFGDMLKSMTGITGAQGLKSAFDYLKYQPPMTNAQITQARLGGLTEAETGGGDAFRTRAEIARDEIAALGKSVDAYQSYFNSLRSANIGVDEARKRTAEYADMQGVVSKATVDTIRTSTTMEDAFQQLRRTTSVLTEATEVAAKAEDALGEVRKKMAGERLNAEIAAYLEGGEKKLAAVRDEQMLQQTMIEMTAARIQKVFGVDVATSLEFAFAHVTDAAARMAAATEAAAEKAKATLAALDQLRYGAMQGGSPLAIATALNRGEIDQGAAERLLRITEAVNAAAAFGAGTLRPGQFDPVSIAQGIASGTYSSEYGNQLLQANAGMNVTVNIQALDGQTAADATVRALSQLEREGRVSAITVVR